jgi:hypothetical protein
MSFFTKASLPHWYSPCLTNPCNWFKVCGIYGLILKVDLAVCCQSPLIFPCKWVSGSPPPPGKLETSFQLFATFLYCLSFFVLFCHPSTSFVIPATSFVIPDVLPLFRSSEYSLSYVIWHFSLRVKWWAILLCLLVGTLDSREGYACIWGYMGNLCTFLSIMLWT